MKDGEKTLFVEKEDTGETFMLDLSPAQEMSIAQELAIIVGGLGELTEEQEVDFGTKVATALLHQVVFEMLGRGQGVLLSVDDTTKMGDVEVTGLNSSLINILGAFRAWDLWRFLGPFMLEGFALVLPIQILLSITPADLEVLGIRSMGHRKAWNAMLNHEGQQAVLRDGRVKSSSAGQAYLQLYDRFLTQKSGSSPSSSARAQPTPVHTEPQAEGRSRNRTRRKKTAAARQRAEAEALRVIEEFTHDQCSGVEERGDGCSEIVLDATGEPEEEPTMLLS